MTGSIWYLDTSATAKLVRRETETAALRRWLRNKAWLTSDLQRTELRRAAARVGGRAPARADRLLAEMDLLSINAEVFDAAARLSGETLRSLDAVHIACAQALGPDLAGIVAYDHRLRRSAEAIGLVVVTPGSKQAAGDPQSG